ncbi:LysR family transcriptional regulator, partial [Pseudomonas aeruginosa]
HPLAGLERVRERDLSEWRLLRMNTYSETGAAINDGLPSSGGRCWSAPNYLLLLEMATHGFGWAELPRPDHIHRLAARPAGHRQLLQPPVGVAADQPARQLGPTEAVGGPF